MSATQDWIKEQFELESKIREEQLGVNTEYNNMRLTREITEMKERLKRLETDMAYTQKIRFAESPEEQRIHDIRRTD